VTRDPEQRPGRLLTAGSALLFGVLGWLLAHAATDRLLGLAGHQHGGGSAHGHLHLPAAILLVACLTAGSALAVIVAALSGRGLPVTGHRSKRSTARRSSLLSTVAFVAAEFAEHAATGGHDIPPAGVLVLGGAVHALMGVASALVWHGYLERVSRLAGMLRGAVPGGSGSRSRSIAAPVVYPRRTWLALALAGRAPPALGAACG
jgi:hypothetical protein